MPEPVVLPSSLHVLIVENHGDTLESLSIYVELLGASVSTAQTMEGALALLGEQTPDVMVSDIGLPDGDGWELLRRARLPPTVYAIAMSGFGLGVDHLKSQDAGYRRHLRKPFNPPELDVLLEEAAREKQARA